MIIIDMSEESIRMQIIFFLLYKCIGIRSSRI